MWDKWEERFKSYGANRVEFQKSSRGGSKGSKSITGAKCLMFFDGDEDIQIGDSTGVVTLNDIIDKTLCSERLQVRILEQKDFEFQMKESKSGSFFGTKMGYTILEFSPTGLGESRGKGKHRPGMIFSRVFKLKKHFQRLEGGGRETTYSFSDTKGIVFSIHLRGSCWEKIPPPDSQQPLIDDYFMSPRSFVHEDSCNKCVYDFQKPEQVKSLIK